MDIEQHWRALYTEARAALDGAGLTEVPLVHIQSEDGPLSVSVDPPFVAYRDETLRVTGVFVAGSLKVLASNWVFSCYGVDLEEALAAASALGTALTDAEIGTVDGYVTTDISPVGLQTLFESDSKLYVCHLRLRWERSL